MAVSSAQFRALDAVERCPHGPCVLSVPALGAGQAARVAREGGSRARLASGTGRGFVALRGGSGRYDGDSRRYIDAQLRGEILEDAERVSKGKLPMFMENIGKTFSGAGAFQFEVGLEAQVPGDIGLDEDEEALQDATVEEAPPPVPVLSPEELEARKVARHAEEGAAARAYFEDLDKTYFTQEEIDADEKLLGWVGGQQRRKYNTEEMTGYFEARKAAQELDVFLKSSPYKDLPAGSKELDDWLEEDEWNVYIDRNGTRHRWEPEDMVEGWEEEVKEWEKEEGGAWKPEPEDLLPTTDPDEALEWVNKTSTRMVNEAWALPRGTFQDYKTHFQKRNGTFETLAILYTQINDTCFLDMREAQEIQAGDNQEMFWAYQAFWGTYHDKFMEFNYGPRHRPEIEEVFKKMEENYVARYGHRALQPFHEEREIDPLCRESSD